MPLAEKEGKDELASLRFQRLRENEILVELTDGFFTVVLI